MSQKVRLVATDDVQISVLQDTTDSQHVGWEKVFGLTRSCSTAS